MRLEFLTETVQHYTVNPRATYIVLQRGIEETNCVYSHSFFGGCAIGRHLPQDLAAKLKGSVIQEQVFNQLPFNLQVYGRSFLWYVQSLHDNCNHWQAHEVGNNLTEAGIRRLAEIKSYFHL